jgi:hypothetical protein
MPTDLRCRLLCCKILFLISDHRASPGADANEDHQAYGLKNLNEGVSERGR